MPRQKLLAADAAIDQAKADAAEAKANLGVAEARFDRSKANLNYAKIVAPFDGVVTHRTFHVGALIRSAAEGGQLPLLTVKRTDLMRVVVLVPDSDVVLPRWATRPWSASMPSMADHLPARWLGLPGPRTPSE